MPVPMWIAIAVDQRYRNRAKWIAGYDPKLGGAVVAVSLSPEKVIGEFIAVLLPCLKCQELGIEKYLKKGAKYPYCSQHTEAAPHRHS